MIIVLPPASYGLPHAADVVDALFSPAPGVCASVALQFRRFLKWLQRASHSMKTRLKGLGDVVHALLKWLLRVISADAASVAAVAESFARDAQTAIAFPAGPLIDDNHVLDAQDTTDNGPEMAAVMTAQLNAVEDAAVNASGQAAAELDCTFPLAGPTSPTTSALSDPHRGLMPPALAMEIRTGTPVLRRLPLQLVPTPEQLAEIREQPVRATRDQFAWYAASAAATRSPASHLTSHLTPEYRFGWTPCRCPECVAYDPTNELAWYVVRPVEIHARLRSFGRGGRVTTSTASATSARLNSACLTSGSRGRMRA